MIMVDTSVWIDYFRGKRNAHTDALDEALAEGAVATGDLIMLEILQGFKADSDFRAAKSALGAVEQFDLLGTARASACANHYRKLRKAGITSRQTSDVIIASFCIEHRMPLLFQDRDFIPFVNQLGLKAAL